jgi:hypothetical protein
MAWRPAVPVLFADCGAGFQPCQGAILGARMEDGWSRMAKARLGNAIFGVRRQPNVGLATPLWNWSRFIGASSKRSRACALQSGATNSLRSLRPLWLKKSNVFVCFVLRGRRSASWLKKSLRCHAEVRLRLCVYLVFCPLCLKKSVSSVVTPALVHESWFTPSGVVMVESTKRTPCA